MESFSNILFSSVVGGPSFVHSPHVPSPAKLNSCSYYFSILDPNMELPELSTKDIDELLCDSNCTKPNKEINTNFDNFCKSVTEQPIASLIIDSKLSLGLLKDNDSNISLCGTVASSSIDNQNSQHSLISSQNSGILFKCIVRSCNNNFTSKAEQMNHFFTEHKDKTITCVSCKSIFKSKYSLHKHFLVNPDCKLKNTYRCTMEPCDKYFFNLHNLEMHLSKQHCVPSISCLSFSCGLKFFDVISRDDHVKNCHNEMTHHCVQCDKVFLTRDLYEKHDSKCHRDNCSRQSGSAQLYSSSVSGCDKFFSPVSSTRQYRQYCHSCTGDSRREQLLIHDDQSITNLQQSEVMVNSEIKIVYACPLPECSEALSDKAEFQSHFLKHFTGELPGDINSLLPPDPPVPGLELHSKTFEANVDYMYQREETNLVQALDLVPDKLWQSLEWLDDTNKLSPNSCLTSALILPSTETANNRNMSVRNNGRRRKNQYDENNVDGTDISGHCPSRSNADRFDADNSNGPRPKYKCTENLSLSLPYSAVLSSTGSCARTCPKVNSAMANLIKRRRVFLKERVGMMQSCDSVLWQPAARQPALKQVVHRIFNSQQLPNKYEETLNVDGSDL